MSDRERVQLRSTTPLRVGEATDSRTAQNKLVYLCDGHDIFPARFMTPFQIVSTGLFNISVNTPTCCTKKRKNMMDVLLCTYAFFTRPTTLLEVLIRTCAGDSDASQIPVLFTLGMWLRSPTNRCFFSDHEFRVLLNSFLEGSSFRTMAASIGKDIESMYTSYTEECTRAVESSTIMEHSVVTVSEFYPRTLEFLFSHDIDAITTCIDAVMWNAFASVPLEEFLQLHRHSLESGPHFAACRTLSHTISSWLGDTLRRAYEDGVDISGSSPNTVDRRSNTLERVASVLINMAVHMHKANNYEGVAMVHRALFNSGGASKYLLSRCPDAAADVFNILTNVSRMEKDSSLVLSTMRTATETGTCYIPNFQGLRMCVIRLHRLFNGRGSAFLSMGPSSDRRGKVNTRVLEVLNDMIRTLKNTRDRRGYECLQTEAFSTFVSVLACHSLINSAHATSPISEKFLYKLSRGNASGCPTWKLSTGMKPRSSGVEDNGDSSSGSDLDTNWDDEFNDVIVETELNTAMQNLVFRKEEIRFLEDDNLNSEDSDTRSIFEENYSNEYN